MMVYHLTCKSNEMGSFQTMDEAIIARDASQQASDHWLQIARDTINVRYEAALRDMVSDDGVSDTIALPPHYPARIIWQVIECHLPPGECLTCIEAAN